MDILLDPTEPSTNPMKRTNNEIDDNLMKQRDAMNTFCENTMSNNHINTNHEGSTSSTEPSSSSVEDIAVRQASPVSTLSLLSSKAPSTLGNHVVTNQSGNTRNSEPPRKRRKLTINEKLEKEKEKQEKARLKAEREQRKGEEKVIEEEKRQAKLEAKKVQMEEKEIKSREREVAKAQKEEERRMKLEEKEHVKRQKEEEEAKKLKSQMRLGAFFIKPTASRMDTESPKIDQKEVDMSDAKIPGSCSPKLETDNRQSDYYTYFLPFALPSYTTMANTAVEAQDQDMFLTRLKEGSPKPTEDLLSSLGLKAPRQQRQKEWPRVGNIMARLHGGKTGNNGGDDGDEDVEQQLRSLSRKYIHFCEDVRPPYSGSYTQISLPSLITKTGRDPFKRVRPNTDYDYDSEAEWEEAEEGEDVDSDGEEETESIGSADEMDGFLDDEEASGQNIMMKRGTIHTETHPISTGICWENNNGHSLTNDPEDFDLSTMKLEWLIEGSFKSIDPYTSSYWETNLPTNNTHIDVNGHIAFPTSMTNDRDKNKSIDSKSMPPPRAPLQTNNSATNQKVLMNNNINTGDKGPLVKTKTVKQPAQKLTGNAFEQFKEAVKGSNLTRSELLKVLKQRFPTFSNDSIKETLMSNFARVGASEKVWRPVEV